MWKKSWPGWKGDFKSWTGHRKQTQLSKKFRHIKGQQSDRRSTLIQLILTGILLFLFPASAPGTNDIGFMWLEQMDRGHMLSSFKKKDLKNEKKVKRTDMIGMMKMPDKKKRGDKKKKRPAMSRPAKFLLKAGHFRSPSFLSDSYCYIQAPGSSIRKLQPEKNRTDLDSMNRPLPGDFINFLSITTSASGTEFVSICSANIVFETELLMKKIIPLKKNQGKNNAPACSKGNLP